MIRNISLLLGLAVLIGDLSAATGGPDTYGYIWKDSDEPDGPVYSWIDITGTGTLVTGLADDNYVGPFTMATSLDYYWYEAKKVWIGSNGYLAFNGVNIAAAFPTIPQAGGANDYIAGMMADLTFTGAGNPGACYYFDDASITVVSYIDVPFWSPTAPNWTGSNTFQIILDKNDSTITFQYEAQTGTTQSNNLTIGIESITGDIGLQHSSNLYPPVGYAVRFYNPATPLIDVTDGAVAWNTAEGTQGTTLGLADDLAMTILVRNTGNMPLAGFTAQGRVLNSGGTALLTDAVQVGSLNPGLDTLITFPSTWTPTSPGTYRFEGSVSGIPNELVTSNNILLQEVTVYDTTASVMNIDWAGASDDGIGIGWDGGNGGVASYVLFPGYPAHVTAATIRIASNAGNSPYSLKIYDDDGPDGGPGTLLDSLFIQAPQAQPGDHVHALTAPIDVLDSGLYVLWSMQGVNVNIAQDVQPPFSRRSYEVLDGTWAEYRDRETADFHLGLQVTPLPVFDAGATGFFGLVNGLNVSTTTTIRTWVRNYGNQTINNFPVGYRFTGEPEVVQTYAGPPIAPGDSSLFSFTTAFTPTVNGPGQMCSWADLPNDAAPTNDTVCVNINITVGLEETATVRLQLAPNPATDRVMLHHLPAGPVRLWVRDLTGRVVMERSWSVTGDRSTVPVDGLAAGTYSLLLSTADRIYGGRLVIER